MEICEKYLEDAQRALKSSMFSKPDPMEAVRSFEGAAQCFENAGNFEKAAQCYVETANLISRADPLKAAEMFSKAAFCIERTGSSPASYYSQAANTFKDIAVQTYRTNPDQGLQLLQKAAENYEKSGDREMAIQCYKVGAEASLERKDYANAIVFYGNAGKCFERHKEYMKALKYYQEVAKLWDLQNVPENVAENYLRMVACLEILKEFDYSSQFAIKAAQKYEQAQQTYKAARAYEKASQMLESIEKFMEAAECYCKAAELVKTLKNLEKFEELYDKASSCYVKAGETHKSVQIKLLLADAFSDDAFRCSKHFEEAVALAGNDPRLKKELLTKQGDTLMAGHDNMKAARSYQEAGALMETLGEPASESYKKAGDAYTLFAASMTKVKNLTMAKEGYGYAVLCFEKAGLKEEAERVRQLTKSDTGEREKQIAEELERLRADFDKGLLPDRYYHQMKEGYEELLRRLKL